MDKSDSPVSRSYKNRKPTQKSFYKQSVSNPQKKSPSSTKVKSVNFNANLRAVKTNGSVKNVHDAHHADKAHNIKQPPDVPHHGNSVHIEMHKSKSKINPTVISNMSLRSKRHTDPHDTPPASWTDGAFLFLYYIFLYMVYAAFWFAYWQLYLLTTPKDGPRYEHHHNISKALRSLEISGIGRRQKTILETICSTKFR